jgi:hypothetical protein
MLGIIINYKVLNVAPNLGGTIKFEIVIVICLLISIFHYVAGMAY